MPHGGLMFFDATLNVFEVLPERVEAILFSLGALFCKMLKRIQWIAVHAFHGVVLKMQCLLALGCGVRLSKRSRDASSTGQHET